MPGLPEPTAGDTDWFVHDRFGMFIHWGIYALPARHEWVKNRERIRDEDYQRYFDHFYPDLYDPAEWARQARSAGMTYIVVTTKHHDGFCLWDSALTVSKGGNMLLNVGPNARGEFEPRALERLRAIGDWMRLHNRSIHGCTASDFVPPPDCRYTQNGSRLYLHVFAWPFRHLHLDGLAGRVEYAQLLNDASEITMRAIDPQQQAQNTTMGGLPPGTLTLELPVQQPPVAVPVIELFLKA